MAEELNWQAFGDAARLPPQNIDAEEAILGGILLDPEAINRVVETLKPEVFYIKAHRDIYEATVGLHNQHKPTDLMNVAAWLRDRELLEKIGGIAKLAQLVERTVSAVNIDALAALVIDKYVRRQLIKAGNDIVQLGYQATEPLENVLDSSEQKIFQLTQTRPQEGLIAVSDTLIHTFQEIETRNQEVSLPGVTCNFYDLDAMTGGFQPSDLIIVAGRPSMGKTSFAINVARNIAELHKLPVAIFSLEMSNEQLVQRMLSTEAGVESNRLRAGRLSQNEWPLLSRAIGVLSELPLYIDDTANMTVMQMRSLSRRLQTEKGGKLGLIMLDYIQLMEGSGDNRVQELSKITRSLKGLARELNCPIIALSQLSRGVEARNNKRPMMSDLRESGCLSGDTLISLADTEVEVPIRDLVGKSGFTVWALNEANNKIEKGVVTNAFSTGVKPVFCLKTSLGRSIRATGNHKFLARDGWKRLDELKVGDRLALPRYLPSSSTQTMSDPELALLGHLLGDGCTLPRHSIQYTTREEDLANLVLSIECQEKIGVNYAPVFPQNVSQEPAIRIGEFIQSQKLLELSTNDIYWDKIVSITPDGETEVYDLTISKYHNFVANHIFTHNSIEQDADLVVMLYRDEYYNQDTPDRGVTEVIITKHRNGPTGTVKLLFDPQFTRFRNLAQGQR
ncbi:replicative DNA helicase [Merismopedia glauca]|uniref:Replicative DNA helicase n=1 Tax=Merismopedia glauca CCAP 1448/3 TaxID=1296344 RepID=A0A2T1BWU3_9CYAN|nr:replicative DNA helicase [Merismopedia glauca]PSB00480.1 replicative DNA helicase [Merismopedia glauca CCAP 1448/3]